VLINGSILSKGRRLAFIEALDEHGGAVKLQGAPSEPGRPSGLSPDFLPYSFNIVIRVWFSPQPATCNPQLSH